MLNSRISLTSPPARLRHDRRLSLECLESRALLAGDMVLHWNDILLGAIRTDRTAPPLAARDMAIVHIAIDDSVNAIVPTHEAYSVHRQVPAGASVEAAVAAAAHRALVELLPGLKSTFDHALADSLANIPDGPAENKGVALGRAVAQQILAIRQHDGAGKQVSYTPGSEPGDWQPTPPDFQQTPVLPQWPYVTPFAMSDGSQFRPPPPPTLTSSQYAAAFNEVKNLGAVDSTMRTADQTQIALFWINGPGTATPPGHWNEVAHIVAETAGNTLEENARLFALLNIAEADAGILCWDAKYQYDFWRPVTGIRAADGDGNPDTSADTAWTPLIPTPAFPSYTSGHSTFSAAAAAVLADFFGTDEFAFTLQSENPAAADRSFSSFSQAAEESGASRIYGGIHWSFDNRQGLDTGKMLGNFVFNNYLRPLSAKLDLSIVSFSTVLMSAAATTHWNDPNPHDSFAAVNLSAAHDSTSRPHANAPPSSSAAAGHDMLDSAKIRGGSQGDSDNSEPGAVVAELGQDESWLSRSITRPQIELR